MMIIFENIQLSLVSASALALLISLFISFLLIKTNTNFKFGSQDQKRLSSLNIIPLGGVAMALSFFIAVRFLGEAGSNFIYISFFALAIAFMGVVDDLVNLNWKIKIILQFLFVAIPVIYLNIYINIENIIKIELNNNLNLFFTVFWVILLMNSINFTDNMDGFASLNTSFIAFALGVISFFFEQNYLADISFILGFSIIGFLILNFPPAKIYMGDSGSLFIGFVLGFISILFNWNPLNESLIYNSFTPVLLFFTIPLLDFLTVFTYRIKNNLSPTTGGTDHISHRLLNKGYSVKTILIIFTGINLLVFFLLSLSIFLNEYSFIVFFIYITFISYLFFKFSKMQILE